MDTHGLPLTEKLPYSFKTNCLLEIAESCTNDVIVVFNRTPLNSLTVPVYSNNSSVLTHEGVDAFLAACRPRHYVHRRAAGKHTATYIPYYSVHSDTNITKEKVHLFTKLFLYYRSNC